MEGVLILNLNYLKLDITLGYSVTNNHVLPPFINIRCFSFVK
jgi:hypothetical protein